MYARAPLAEPEIERVLAEVRGRPELPRLEGWFTIPRTVAP